MFNEPPCLAYFYANISVSKIKIRERINEAECSRRELDEMLLHYLINQKNHKDFSFNQCYCISNQKHQNTLKPFLTLVCKTNARQKMEKRIGKSTHNGIISWKLWPI